MSNEDPLTAMLKKRGLTGEQIMFLVCVLNKIREQKVEGKVNEEAVVRLALQQCVDGK